MLEKISPTGNGSKEELNVGLKNTAIFLALNE